MAETFLSRLRFALRVLRRGPPDDGFLAPESSRDPNHRTYKGFVSRSVPQPDGRDLGYCNLYFVRKDGGESCCGQIGLGRREFEAAVESALRRPLPTWMTGEPPAWSPHTDHGRIARTCCHDVPLDGDCDRCLESYGWARPQRL